MRIGWSCRRATPPVVESLVPRPSLVSARAFFYAGTRALLVSHWPVNSYAATMLTSRTFAEMRKDKDIGRSEAFRRAMLALMSDAPWAAHPSVWAPFIVVGEGGAPAKVAAATAVASCR